MSIVNSNQIQDVPSWSSAIYRYASIFVDIDIFFIDLKSSSIEVLIYSSQNPLN
ncbi:MAG: hypothetical protein ACFFAE_08400 [Candidatus Hodarchaeota archaeon]